MKPCKDIRSSFVEALYGEFSTEDKERFYDHLDSCVACNKSFHRMKQNLEVMSSHKRDEPDTQFWDGYWNRLEQRMERDKKPSTLWRQHWIYRAAAVILLIGAGVIVGRMSRVEPRQGTSMAKTAPVQMPVVQTGLQERTQDFLGRSEILLLGLVNFDASKQDMAAIDITRQKRISRGLVHEASDLKKELSDNKDRRLENLVGDLELILFQIANLEEKEDLPEIEMVKSGVDRKGLLLKINLEQMRSRSALSGNRKSSSGNSGI